jgi:Fe2+ transport system protein FeoA
MKVKNQEIPCPCPHKDHDECGVRKRNGNGSAKPLSTMCGCDKFKVCKVKGDRKLCARMAQLGVLPGSEIELICPVQSENCMVRIKGATISLDQLSAENILVEPC